MLSVAAASPRILVVDDSTLIRSVMADELREVGFEVDVASSNAKALEAIAHRPPDVAILDLFLEDGATGFEVARTLRSSRATEMTFIIALSGHYAPDCVRLARDAGCDRFLVKPCPTDDIVEMIGLFLGSRAAGA